MKRIRIKSIDYLISNRLKQIEKSNFTVVKSYEIVDHEKREFSLGLHCNKCNTCFLQNFTTKYKSLPSCPTCSILQIEQTFSKSTYKFLYESDGYVHFKCAGCHSLKRYTRQASTKVPADCIECKKIICTEHLANHGYVITNTQKARFEVSCKTCGTNRTIKDCSSVFRLKLHCANCDKRQAKTARRQAHFEILQTGESHTLCRCTKCGYFRRNDFQKEYDGTRCINCKRLAFEARIEKEKSFIVDYNDAEQNITVQLPDGTRKTVTVSHFMDEKRGHLDRGTWGSPTCVYVILVYFENKTYCKIGTAIDPEQRRKTLKLSGESSVFVIGKFQTRKEADEIEKLFHKAFSTHKISPKEAEKFSNRLTPRGKLDGINEWFDAGVVSKIGKILNGIHSNSTGQIGSSRS